MALAIIFALWYVNEKTLAMHSINTAKRELFYWAAILLTRPLGASIGDLRSQAKEDSRLGFGTTGTRILFLAIITSLVTYLTLKQRKTINQS